MGFRRSPICSVSRPRATPEGLHSFLCQRSDGVSPCLQRYLAKYVKHAPCLALTPLSAAVHLVGLMGPVHIGILSFKDGHGILFNALLPAFPSEGGSPAGNLVCYRSRSPLHGAFGPSLSVHCAPFFRQLLSLRPVVVCCPTSYHVFIPCTVFLMRRAGIIGSSLTCPLPPSFKGTAFFIRLNRVQQYSYVLWRPCRG